MDFLGVLQKPWPVLLIQFLLPQDHLNILRCMINLALRLVDLGVEGEFHMVGLLECIGVACEGESARCNVKLYFRRRDIWYGDGKVDVVFCGFSFGGALSPEDCTMSVAAISSRCLSGSIEPL